ncbi:MAG: hypothetical protein ABJL17_08975 [Parvibaculum sp.]|uniref:hypothetical protein n=1 Tax=Parvibaculum sp. TaxID=2024848 RepID=UPI003267B8D6
MAEDESLGLSEESRVTAGELTVAYSGPSFASNKFYVSMTPEGVRIAFTEVHPNIPGPQFRTAVMLSYNDGVSLMLLLRDMFEQNAGRISELGAEQHEYFRREEDEDAGK